jgi:hypothetical protein
LRPAANPPCWFILQPYGNRGVLILRLDGWHERPRSIYTPHGRKMLKEPLHAQKRAFQFSSSLFMGVLLQCCTAT